MASRRPSEFKIDLSVLVDVISNAAGMMILLACMALISKMTPVRSLEPDVKPIEFPLSYFPVGKNNVSIALKNGRFYVLPAEDLLEAVLAENQKGIPIKRLELQANGVNAWIQYTRTGLGFLFLYKLDPQGGVPLRQPARIRHEVDKLLTKYPPDKYFLTIYCWPDEFESLRDIREYANKKGMVVGWQPRIEHEKMQTTDIVMAIGEYDDRFTSIRAQ